MGVELYMRTENLEIDEKYPEGVGLDRAFQGLTCSTMYSLEKLGKIYDIDLSFLEISNYKGLPSYAEDYLDYVDYLIREAKDEKESIDIKAKAKIEYEEMKTKEKLSELNDWTPIEKVENILKEIIQKMRDEPEKMINYLNPKDTYLYSAYKHSNGSPPKDHWFIGQFQNILDFLDYAKENGCRKFAFYYL